MSVVQTNLDLKAEQVLKRGGRLAGEKFSLKLKGLAVVVCLLVFELTIFVFLYMQVEQAEKEALHAVRLKEIAAHTEKLGRVLWESRRTLNKYLLERNQSSWDEYSRLSDQLPRTVDWLKAQNEYTENQKALLLQIEGKISQCRNWLLSSKTKVDNMSASESLQFLNSRENGILVVYQTLINDIIALGKLTDKQLESAPVAQRKHREEFRQVIFAGVIINVIIALALALLFIRSITNRLKLMVENTCRLKESKELLQPVGGADEISSLDAAFHKMAAELKEAQRMKQAFVAMISHELRTPLTSVGGFLELLSMGALGEVSKPIVEQSDRVHANVERLIKLINDLLDLEKMEAGRMKMAPCLVSLQAAVDRSLQSVAEQCRTNSVAIEVQNCDFQVFADDDRLEQVLVNLLSNAVKFSPPESKVRVEASSRGEFVEVRIIDQGRGVPQEQQERIFERYQQVDVQDGSKRGGTGLGLPVCRLIVDQLGGSIGVESSAGKGSTFWFRVLKAAREDFFQAN